MKCKETAKSKMQIEMELFIYVGCFYKGRSYRQTQEWYDGCQYKCECINEMTGQYRCMERYFLILLACLTRLNFCMRILANFLSSILNDEN